jgi:hypothetical protein
MIEEDEGVKFSDETMNKEEIAESNLDDLAAQLKAMMN